MSIFTKIKDVTSAIPGVLRNIAPGRELARGLGISLAFPEVERQQEKLNQQQGELQSRLVMAMKEARDSGDNDRFNRLKNVARQTNNAEVPNLIDEIVKDAPTNRQVLASAGELGLFAALGFKPGAKGAGLQSRASIKALGSVKRARKLEALKNAGKLEKFTKMKGLNLARESLIGSSFFALVEAQKKDADTKDIVRAAEFGALLGPATLLGSEAIAKGISAVSPRVSGAVKRGVSRLEEFTTRRTPTPAATNEVGKVLSTIGEAPAGIKRVGAEALLKGVQSARQFKARFVDRFSPLKRVEDLLLETKQTPLKQNELIYRDARLLQSTADAAAETKVVQLMDDLRPHNDILNESKAYVTLLDYIDRAKLGQKTPLGTNVSRLNSRLKTLAQEIGPEKMQRVGKVREIIGDYNRNLLQERVEAGVISQETMDTLLKTHPNYVPHNVIMDIDEQAIGFTVGSLNVPKTDIMKAVGSARNIEDPLVAVIQRTPIATRTIEKNKLLNNLIRAQEETGVLTGMRQRVGDEPVKEGLEGTINLFRNGQKETWVVPKDIEVAVKNLDAPLTPFWWKALTLPQKLLKKGATQFNLSFALPNKFRDKQTAALASEAFIDAMAKRAGVATPKLPKTKQALQDLYKRSGGYGASIFREGEEEIFRKMSKVGMGERVIEPNPFKLIDKINSSFEQQTRLNVFSQALKKGLSPKDAAFVSRNATIDFAKMGSWMRPINQAVPFLNARVQGFINLPTAFINRPETFARMQLWTGVYPTIALHQHNRRYESYDNIGQYFKNKYWIIMTGESESVDKYTGNPIKVPNFITIPKGEGQALVSGPIQAFLDKQDGRDFRKTSEIIADTIGSASPLEFQGFDQSNFWLTTISQLGPAATIPVGLGTNIQPFFGNPIIPEGRLEAPEKLQFKPTTPEVTKELADIMNVAPARLEFILNSFGGLPQDAQDMADILFGLVKREDIIEDLKEESLSETDFGLGARFPLSRRFLREASEFYSPESQFRRRQKEKIQEEVVGDKLKIRDKADEIFREMNRRDDSQDRLNYLNSLGDELTPEIRKRLSALKKRRQTVEALKPNDSVELRARYINLRLEEMKSAGIDLQDRVEFLNELQRNKILTKQVKKMLAIIKNQ